MPLLKQTVEIHAAPDVVFDLIAEVATLSEMTEVITEIRATGAGTYHWRVRAAGISLEWDSRITECERPRRLSWKSVSGVENAGTYVLEPTATGTLVSLSLEYRLPSRVIELVVARVADPLVRKVGAQVLRNVKARIETPPAEK